MPKTKNGMKLPMSVFFNGLRTVAFSDFPGDPVVRTPHFQRKERFVSSILAWRTKIPHAVQHTRKNIQRDVGSPPLQ